LLTVTKPDGTKDDSKLWDLINFLQVLPYPKMLDKYGIRLDTIPASESADKK
jgi:hypothetical protein